MRYEDVDELNEEIHKIDKFDTEFGIEHCINNSKKKRLGREGDVRPAMSRVITSSIEFHVKSKLFIVDTCNTYFSLSKVLNIF